MSTLTVVRPAIVLFAALSLITGIAYPLAVTGAAQAIFPAQANGSLIASPDGKVAGSSLLGQEFSSGEPAESCKWFWGRLSATGPVPYTAFNGDTGSGSSGSNLAPSNPTLVANAQARIAALAAADLAATYSRPANQPIPVDLVTASGSGLDPHISLAAATYQLPRVAKARGLTEAALSQLVEQHTTGRTLGVLGEPVVNVLSLNRAVQSAK